MIYTTEVQHMTAGIVAHRIIAVGHIVHNG